MIVSEKGHGGIVQALLDKGAEISTTKTRKVPQP